MSAEARREFRCFGGTASVRVRGATAEDGEAGAARAEARLLDSHERLSRFIPDSELSRLNCDPRAAVPASKLVRALAAAVKMAGEHSGGLVDATLVDEIEAAGYRESLGEHTPMPLSEALADAPPSSPARPSRDRRWSAVRVDSAAGAVVRPPGLRIDGGGIAKGLLADLVAATLEDQLAYAVDCCGDLRLGGRTGAPRRVLVESPFGGEPVHELRLERGAVATTGIGKRCWIGPDGALAHHVLDPGRGRPAFTGVVQATAVAGTGLLAEVQAKAALLSGPERAAEWLPHGGVVVRDDGVVDVFAPERPLPRAVAAR